MGEITGNGQAVTGLGGARGYGETELPRADEAAVAVDVSAVFQDGFSLGGVHYAADALYVSTDGLISFGAGVAGVAESLASIAAPFFAIFHADVDTRLDGEGAESGGVWLDVDAVADCVTITWDHVGFYRRNATLTNTFQIQLFDRGNGGFDLVFRYQDISWTSGDLQGGFGGLGGLAALVGQWAGGTAALAELAASGNEAALLALDQALGNTGVQGLWVWSHAAPSVITGTARADVLAGTSADDTMLGLGGSDVLQGSAGADSLDGGSGSDRADYGLATGAIRLDLLDPSLNRGQAAGDRFTSVEVFAGSAWADTLRGGDAGDWLVGASGDDLIDGRSGHDQLEGGDGADDLRGFDGNDSLACGTGNDRADGQRGDDTVLGEAGDDSLSGGNGADLVDGGEGADALAGGATGDTVLGGAGDGADTLSGGRGSDLMQGGGGADALNGASGLDRLSGGAGDDRLSGGSGNDSLSGDSGNDRLRGGGDADWLDGGLGDDILGGGAGADSFFHAGSAGQGTDLVGDYDAVQGDVLVFGLAGAAPGDFRLQTQALPGQGAPGLAEVQVIHVPTGNVLWVLQDGAALTSILLQAGGQTFDLL